MPALRAGTVLALVLFLAAALACEQRAAAHSWYPAKCCAGHDCRKVDSIEKLEDGDLLFRAGPVLVVVPAEFMRLPRRTTTRTCASTGSAPASTARDACSCPG
jgi:hypothetical protein